MFVPQKGPPFLLEPFDGKERPAVFLEATLARSARIWCSLLWRTALLAFVVGSVMWLAAVAILGAGTDRWVVLVCYVLAMMVSGVVATGRVLGKQFAGFRPALVSVHPHLIG